MAVEEQNDRARQVIDKVDAYFSEFRDRTPAGRRLIAGQLTNLRAELRSVSDDTYLVELFSKLEVACAELSKLTIDAATEERQIVFGMGDVAGMRARLGVLKD